MTDKNQMPVKLSGKENKWVLNVVFTVTMITIQDTLGRPEKSLHTIFSQIKLIKTNISKIVSGTVFEYIVRVKIIRLKPWIDVCIKCRYCYNHNV